jgi:hypothetical protein
MSAIIGTKELFRREFIEYSFIQSSLWPTEELFEPEEKVKLDNQIRKIRSRRLNAEKPNNENMVTIGITEEIKLKLERIRSKKASRPIMRPLITC